MKRIFSLSIVLLLLTIFAFSAGQTESASAAAPKKIVAFLDTTFLVPEWGQKEVRDKYQELTRIELEVIQPPHNQYYEKVQLAFASGDFPDVIELNSDKLIEYVQEGAIVDITSQIENSAIIQKIPRQYIESVRFADGKLYSVGFNTGGGCLTYVRKDWLDKLGLGIPKTWNGYYKMLVAFANNDPDGNGKKDTIAYVAPGVTDDMYLRDIMQGAYLDFHFRKGKWVDGYAQPEFAAAMERLQKCYAQGLIDPEVFTNKTSTCREKVYSGRVGVFTYWSGTWNERLEDGIRNGPVGKSAEFVPIPAIEGSHYRNRIAVQNAITIGAKDPDFVFKNFIEFIHDGKEGQLLFTHGVEGVHWAVKDGKRQKLPRLDDPKLMFQKSYIHPELQPAPWDDPFELSFRVKNSVAIHTAGAEQEKLKPVSPTLIKVSGDLKALREEIVSKITIGELGVAEGLARYKTESEALGMSQILAELNK